MLNVKIRAHHALCLQFFCGKGYNNSFIENMKYISNVLCKNPLITIIDYGDDICSECPNFMNHEKCLDQEKVSLYDSKVLQYCSIKSGSIMYWNDFQDAVYKNILSVHKRGMICKECKWNEICENYK
jgi:hypothetical protein